MYSIISSVSDIDSIQWKELVAKSPTASFFQTRECYDFYATLSFLRPFIYAVSENDQLVGILCGYVISDGNLLKQFFSRRAIVPGGLLLDAGISHIALQQLLKHATLQLKKQAIYLEIRNYNDFSSFHSTFELAGFRFKAHLNFHVATPDLESSLQKLNSSKRRQIKLSLKAGATIVDAITDDEIAQFYYLLKELYKNKIKSPLFPLEFFRKLNALQYGKILVVKFNDKVVGGIACVFLDNRVVSEWFVCGDDGIEKKLYPSVLATWAGIEYAAKNGYDRFDFMGAGKPDESYGVREFKSKFGGELVEHGRFLYICKPLLYSLGKYIVQKRKRAK